MSVRKKILIISLTILLLICAFINIWYLYIRMFGVQKVVSSTFEVGLQSLKNEENPDTKYFIEINYLSNQAQNGDEVFEIKFNYMLDENQSAFYSQGLQFVAKSK